MIDNIIPPVPDPNNLPIVEDLLDNESEQPMPAERVSLTLRLPEALSSEGQDNTIQVSYKVGGHPVHKCLPPGVRGTCPGSVPVTSIKVGDFICVKGLVFAEGCCSKMEVIAAS